MRKVQDARLSIKKRVTFFHVLKKFVKKDALQFTAEETKVD